MEPLHIADDVELHVVFLEFQEILAQVTLHEIHDVRHFFIRALPIFRRKGIDRQDLDAQVVGSDDDALERIGTGAMAVTAGRPLRLAQRPLPSMMMATWRGMLFGSSMASDTEPAVSFFCQKS